MPTLEERVSTCVIPAPLTHCLVLINYNIWKRWNLIFSAAPVLQQGLSISKRKQAAVIKEEIYVIGSMSHSWVLSCVCACVCKWDTFSGVFTCLLCSRRAARWTFCYLPASQYFYFRLAVLISHTRDKSRQNNTFPSAAGLLHHGHRRCLFH